MSHRPNTIIIAANVPFIPNNPNQLDNFAHPKQVRRQKERPAKPRAFEILKFGV
jgi:hypothetical protein